MSRTTSSQRFVWDDERRRFYPVPMGAEDENDPPGDPKDGTDPAPKNDDPPTFSQDDLNRVAAREKAQGKAAAERELAEQLGVSLDDAKDIIRQAKEREDSEKSDAQKAREAADREKAEAESEKRKAAEERHATRVERMLMRAGATDEKKLQRVLRMVDAEVGASEEDVQASIESLKEEVPEIFAAGSDGGDGKPPTKRIPDSDPKGKQPQGKQSEDAYSRGAERAKEHAGAGVSYEGIV